MHRRWIGIGLVMALVGPCSVGARQPPLSVRARFADPGTRVLVVAHRACHNPAPLRGIAHSVPENALTGIERCIALGVDVAEVDVRRTRDGYLVLMHDERVDRTTDGHGAVAEMTLAEVRALRLRANEGGPDAPVTDERVPTLEAALALARGRILLNLDVQAGVYAETVALVRRLRGADRVIVKQPAGSGSPVLADTPPFDAVSFMPILAEGLDPLPLAARQLTARHRPVAIELPRMTDTALPALCVMARRARIRLWANSLWEGFIRGYGGDRQALAHPAAVWGRMRDAGIGAIQTDEPDALLAYLAVDPTVTRRPPVPCAARSVDRTAVPAAAASSS